MNTIDWRELALRIHIDPSQGGSVAAQAALAALLGDAAIRNAVDWYVSGKEGAELARGVLWQLRPWPAMIRCMELLNTSSEPHVRESAVDLLRVVADRRALQWVSRLLADPQPSVRLQSLLIVDQLRYSLLIELEDAEPLLQIADQSAHPQLQQLAAELRSRPWFKPSDEA